MTININLSVRFVTLLFAIISFCTQIIIAQENPVVHRVFSTGNLTDIKDINLFNERVESILAATSDPFTFIINGDLISGEKGENIEESVHSFKILLEQFQNKNGKIIIVPGDRDWANSGESGWKKVKIILTDSYFILTFSIFKSSKILTSIESIV